MRSYLLSSSPSSTLLAAAAMEKHLLCSPPCHAAPAGMQESAGETELQTSAFARQLLGTRSSCAVEFPAQQESPKGGLCLSMFSPPQ